LKALEVGRRRKVIQKKKVYGSILVGRRGGVRGGGGGISSGEAIILAFESRKGERTGKALMIVKGG